MVEDILTVVLFLNLTEEIMLNIREEMGQVKGKMKFVAQAPKKVLPFS